MRRYFSTSKAIFNDNVKILHKDRSAKYFLQNKNAPKYEYLRDSIATQLVDRVRDISREFPVVLDFGCNTGNIAGNLIEDYLTFPPDDDVEFESPGAIKSIIHLDPSSVMIDAAKSRIESIDKCPFETSYHVNPLISCKDIVESNSVDMIISNLSLHWTSDLRTTVSSAIKCLKPDGAFLASMLGGDSLFELRTALAIAEQEREGGLSPHISPMLPVADACGLLSDAGLTLCTIDTLNVDVQYENAFECMQHLSGMGESNGLINRRPNISRETLLAAAAIYQSMFGNEDRTVTASFQVIFMIGWKPHESQPKPKERGSQDFSLDSLSDHIKFNSVDSIEKS